MTTQLILFAFAVKLGLVSVFVVVRQMRRAQRAVERFREHSRAGGYYIGLD